MKSKGQFVTVNHQETMWPTRSCSCTTGPSLHSQNLEPQYITDNLSPGLSELQRRRQASCWDVNQRESVHCTVHWVHAEDGCCPPMLRSVVHEVLASLIVPLNEPDYLKSDIDPGISGICRSEGTFCLEVAGVACHWVSVCWGSALCWLCCYETCWPLA